MGIRSPRRLGVGALLAALGIATNDAPEFTTWHNWMVGCIGAPLASPALRASKTRGWHQKRNRRAGPNYAKLLRRQARAAA